MNNKQWKLTKWGGGAFPTPVSIFMPPRLSVVIIYAAEYRFISLIPKHKQYSITVKPHLEFTTLIIKVKIWQFSSVPTPITFIYTNLT
jgi:hypothetical protein